MTLKFKPLGKVVEMKVGEVIGDVINEQISIPSSLEGTGIGTNPDELLVSAASSCYIISLAATLERAGYKDISHSNPSAMLKIQNDIHHTLSRNQSGRQ